MSISIYNLKKWSKMFCGKSVLHVNQNLGTQFIPGEIKGYFNNLIEKVTMEPELLNCEKLPTVETEKGERISFPVSIFQYGLGAYDLYLKTNDKKYYTKFEQCATWAFKNQEVSGAWNNFFFVYPDHPYSAMCQGEGSSLLVRAYKISNDKKYYNAAKKAVDFMIQPIENGGTNRVQGNEMCLLEYTHRDAVLNGWIFALFGLYDFILVNSISEYNEVFDKTISTLKSYMKNFDRRYWSNYDLEGRISSPFYHNLHIAQMEALYLITKCEDFKMYADKWKKQKTNPVKQTCAVIKKIGQKIIEKNV